MMGKILLSFFPSNYVHEEDNIYVSRSCHAYKSMRLFNHIIHCQVCLSINSITEQFDRQKYDARQDRIFGPSHFVLKVGELGRELILILNNKMHSFIILYCYRMVYEVHAFF